MASLRAEKLWENGSKTWLQDSGNRKGIRNQLLQCAERGFPREVQGETLLLVFHNQLKGHGGADNETSSSNDPTDLISRTVFPHLKLTPCHTYSIPSREYS